MSYRVADADAHVVEPRDLFEDYMDPFWVPNPTPHKLGYVVDEKGRRVPNRPFALAHIADFHGSGAGTFNPELRLKHMDQEGRDVDVLYPSFAIPTASYENSPHRVSICKAYNDWLAKYCKADIERLKGVALIPLYDVRQSVGELERCIQDLNMVGVNLWSSYLWPAYGTGGPYERIDLDHPILQPFWEKASDLNVPIGIHARNHLSALGMPRERPYDQYRMQVATLPIDLMTVLLICMSGGLLDEFPKLRFAFLEGGCSWIPFWLERMGDVRHTMDRTFEELPRKFPELAELLSDEKANMTPIRMKKEPTDYVRRGQVYFSSESDEKGLSYAIRELGEDCIMYTSDYPHFDSKFPNTVRIVRQRDDMTESMKRKFMGENCIRFYGLKA